MEAVKTFDLTKKYKEKTAVNKLDLTVHKGELYALLGVNGAGKSTTIKMLSCLTQPTSGDAELMGHSVVKESTKVKSLINVSPQETAVAAKLSVRENLEFIARIYGSNNQKQSRHALGRLAAQTEHCNGAHHRAGDTLFRRAYAWA